MFSLDLQCYAHFVRCRSRRVSVDRSNGNFNHRNQRNFILHYNVTARAVHSKTSLDAQKGRYCEGITQVYS
jgi:hypothetical protein